MTPAFLIEFTNPDGSKYQSAPIFSTAELAWERAEMICSYLNIGHDYIYPLTDPVSGESKEAAAVLDRKVSYDLLKAA